MKLTTNFDFFFLAWSDFFVTTRGRFDAWNFTLFIFRRFGFTVKMRWYRRLLQMCVQLSNRTRIFQVKDARLNRSRLLSYAKTNQFNLMCFWRIRFFPTQKCMHNEAKVRRLTHLFFFTRSYDDDTLQYLMSRTKHLHNVTPTRVIAFPWTICRTEPCGTATCRSIMSYENKHRYINFDLAIWTQFQLLTDAFFKSFEVWMEMTHILWVWIPHCGMFSHCNFKIMRQRWKIAHYKSIMKIGSIVNGKNILWRERSHLCGKIWDVVNFV